MPARVLVTGFEPFGPHGSNPSAEAVRLLCADPELADAGVVTAVLPVDRRRSATALARLLARHRPRFALMAGLAARRSTLTLERVAVNWWQAPGEPGLGRRIRRDGPDGLLATLPAEAVLAALRSAGSPAEVSESAGTYACNLVLYEALLAARSGLVPRLRAGFVHVPPTPDALPPGVTAPTVPLATITAALREAARVLAGGGRAAGGSRRPRGRTGLGPRGRRA